MSNDRKITRWQGVPQKVVLYLIRQQGIPLAIDLQPAVTAELPMIRFLVLPFPTGLEDAFKIIAEQDASR